MSTTIYGTPVGTPISPEKIAEVLRMVKTVNGQEPDENGNVTIDVGSVDAEQLNEAVREALQAAKESGEFNGKDGVSPTIESEGIEEGTLLHITNADGSTEDVLIRDGTDGKPGDPGGDGLSAYDVAVQQQGFVGNATEWLESLVGVTFTPHVDADGNLSWTASKNVPVPEPVNIRGGNGVSPTVSISPITGGYRISITDKDGTKTADIMNGQKGDDGISPTVSVSKSGKVTTVSITDKNGTKTATINDGADGKTPVKGVDYNDGASVTVSRVSESAESGGSNVVTFSDGKVLNIKNGKDGKTPVKGTDYWTPADKTGIITDLINTDEFKAKADTFSEWESVNAEIVTDKLFFHGWETSIRDYSNGTYIKTDISMYSKLKLTTYEWGSVDYPFYAFLDSTGNIVSFESGATAKTYTDYEVVVPNGAVTIILNGRVGNAIGIKGLKVSNIKTLSAEKANRIAKWVTVPFDLVSGNLIKYDGSLYAHSSGGHTTVDVKSYKKVKVIGQQWQLNNFYVCYFYDATNAIIGKYGGSTQNKPAELSLDVPEGAVKMVVNGTSSPTSIEITAYEVFDMGNLYQLLRPTGLKLLTLGDSITALGTTVTGWVKYFIEKTGCELVANVAVNGARLHDHGDTVYDGAPVCNGPDDNHNNVLGNQVQKIINDGYEAPDIIIIAIGTNAGISITTEDMTAAYYGSGTSLLPLESVDRTKSAGAYRYCLEKLHSLYPNAIIFWCTPIMGYQATRSAENAMKYAESLRIATEYTGQMLIDTIRCGINGANEQQSANGEYLVDGLHPNVNGAKKIGYYNASKVREFLGNNFKEI